MTSKLLKNAIRNFLFCFVAAILCTVLIERLFTRLYDNTISLFFYILIIGFPVIFPLAGIYFLYFVSSFYVVRKIKLTIIRVFALLLYGVLFFFIVLKVNWLVSKSRYHSFDEYIKEGNVYLTFSIIAVIQIGFLRRRASRQTI
jgi:hypothetical protein